MSSSRQERIYEESCKFDNYENAAKYIVDLAEEAKIKNYDGIKVKCQFDDVAFQYAYSFKNHNIITEEMLATTNVSKGLYPLFIGREIGPGSNVDSLCYNNPSKLIHDGRFIVDAKTELFFKQLMAHGFPYPAIVPHDFSRADIGIAPAKNIGKISSSHNSAQPTNPPKLAPTKSTHSEKNTLEKNDGQVFTLSGNNNFTFAKSKKSVTIENGEVKTIETGPICTLNGQQLDPSQSIIQQMRK